MFSLKWCDNKIDKEETALEILKNEKNLRIQPKLPEPKVKSENDNMLKNLEQEILNFIENIRLNNQDESRVIEEVISTVTEPFDNSH